MHNILFVLKAGRIVKVLWKISKMKTIGRWIFKRTLRTIIQLDLRDKRIAEQSVCWIFDKNCGTLRSNCLLVRWRCTWVPRGLQLKGEGNDIIMNL